MSSSLQRACAIMSAWQLCACGKIIGIEELDSPPIVRIMPTTVHDELGDAIVFDELGVPVHTPGDRMVTLGQPGSGTIFCPVLHKFTHRLDDPNDNAIRWQFEVVSQGIARVAAEAGMYRLRLRQSPSDFGGDSGWLTDWAPAQAIGTVENGVHYEAMVLRSQVPSLATVRGTIEVEFRGANEFGVESVPIRYCWQHVPLAAPLQVRNVVEAMGPGSLHETNLAPDNNMAPLLEGVPLEQGRAVMELEIVNGTAEAVYATLAIEQDQATYSRSWQKTNAFLFAEYEESDCLIMGECTLGFPSDHRTVLVTAESGTLDGAANGLVVQDTFTEQRISPCEGCDPDTYLIEPRTTLGDPRIYRVRLLITDLRMLAPQLPGVSLGPFSDTPLDAEMLLTPITGQIFGRFRLCTSMMSDTQSCLSSIVYQHYVALTEASLSLPRVHITARTSPSPELPAIMPAEQPGVLGAPVGIEAYHWSTVEEPLPMDPEPVDQP